MDNSLIEAREIYNDILKRNNMCRQPNTPMEYKHAELMRELNEFSIALKVHLHPEKLGHVLPDTLADLQRRYPKPDLDAINDLHQRIHQVLQQDATPFVKYLQEPMDVKQGPHPGIIEY